MCRPSALWGTTSAPWTISPWRVRLPAPSDSLGLIKRAAAQVNAALGLLPETRAQAIAQAADEVAQALHDVHLSLWTSFRPARVPRLT